MSKLIEKFRQAPTQANRDRLALYLRKHMMASCMATPEESCFLRANGFSA